MSNPRRFNDRFQDRIVLSIDLASTAATATVKFHPCDRAFVVESVKYINPTGLAQDPTNYFDIELKDAAVSMAKWSTLTGAQGTIAAGTFVTAPLTANINAAAADVLSAVLTLHGAQTLPAGRLVVHGRYL